MHEREVTTVTKNAGYHLLFGSLEYKTQQLIVSLDSIKLRRKNNETDSQTKQNVSPCIQDVRLLLLLRRLGTKCGALEESIKANLFEGQ